MTKRHDMIYLDAPCKLCFVCVECCVQCVRERRWPISPLSSWLWPFKERVLRRRERESCKLWREDYQPDLLSPLKLYWLLSSLIMSVRIWMKTLRADEVNLRRAEGRRGTHQVSEGEGRWLGTAAVVQTVALMLVETFSLRIRGNEIKQRNISFSWIQAFTRKRVLTWRFCAHKINIAFVWLKSLECGMSSSKCSFD